MTRMRRFYTHVFCLLAYLWSATCLGETLLIHQFSAHDPHGAVTVTEAAGEGWVFHHAGHRDSHEPNAQDVSEPAAESAHGDHTVTCADAEAVANAKTATPDKAPDNLFAAALPLPVPYLTAAAPNPRRVGSLPLVRTTPQAIARLTRLRI